MPIASTALSYYLTGAASDGAASTPASSLGGFRASTVFSTAVDNNLFDDVSGDEAADGDTEYRCYCIKNENASLPLLAPKIWIKTAVDDADATMAFAVERPALSLATTGPAQGPVASEGIGPTVNISSSVGVGSGISDWSTAASKASGVGMNLGTHGVDLSMSELIYVWTRRVYASGAGAQASVSVSFTVEGDTAA